MTTLVKDKSHFTRFVTEVMKPLLPGEKYFISLSARNKYLTEEERRYYNLGRTEMFGRTLGNGDWDFTMAKLAANLQYRTTKSGMSYPDKALVVYVNINPSNSVQACGRFAQKVVEMQNELMNGFLNGKTPNLDSFTKGDRLLMNFYQKTPGTRHYLDVDVDGSYALTVELTNALDDSGTKHHLIKTRGGYHVMIDRISRNKTKFPVHEVVQSLHKEAKAVDGEVIINGNAMVPMPGTLQGGTLVELVY